MVRNQWVVGLLVLAALLLSACQAVVAQPQAPPSDEEVAAAVNAIWDEYEAAQMASDPERWIALWTDDGVKMPPNGPALDGKDPIFVRVQRGMTNAPVDEMVITALETQNAGDWAYSRGNFTVTYTIAETGVQEMMDGKFMTILQRQPDGTWKIHRDIHNSNVPPAPAAAPTTDAAAVAEAIDAIWREYEASLLAGDVDRWIAQWMEDGVQMPPNMPPRVGKETIFAAVSGFLSQYEYTDFVIDNEDAEVNGDLAFARGTYAASFAAKAGGDPVGVEGKYMTILRRQADGSWKIYRDIFNSNVPPAPAAAPTTDAATVAEAIDAVWREYEASQIAGDPDRWIALWADDGVQLPPGSPPVVGKEAIDARDRSDLEVNDYSEFVITNKEVEVNGDLAFARGDFKVTVAPKSGGDPVDFEGKYMTIFRQQADGSWKIYRDIFNPSAP